MNFLRPIFVLACIAIPIWIGTTYSEHHSDESPFKTLYMHVQPARLVVHPAAHGGHGEAAEEHAGEAEEHGEVDLLFPALTVPLPARVDAVPEMEGTQFAVTNLQIFQLAAVLLCFACLGGVATYVRRGRGDFVSRLFAGFVMWIRDEMVYPNMGEETGKKFLPFFLSLFFFILFMNLLGLMPGGATATASIFVTGALAVITLFSMVICGMVVQGPLKFWLNLVPHVPLALWPLMFIVELLGLFVKPFALMVRLFANMTGGHLVVLSFMGLIFFFGAMSPAVGYASSPVAVAFAVFIMIIEAFVALLQAYIFTQLSIIFVQASLHAEH